MSGKFFFINHDNILLQLNLNQKVIAYSYKQHIIYSEQMLEFSTYMICRHDLEDLRSVDFHVYLYATLEGRKIQRNFHGTFSMIRILLVIQYHNLQLQRLVDKLISNLGRQYSSIVI